MPDQRPALILVHGAWHGSWCWERVTPLLAARGLAVHTVELPSVSAPESSAVREAALSADASAVRAVMDAVAGPVVLCGHSYGGMVISLAASGRRRASRLTYLCAFMPEAGQSLLACGEGIPTPWIRALDDGMTLPHLTRAADVFYADCDSATVRWAVSRLRPQPAAAYAEPVPDPAWREIPSTYIVCNEDRAIPAELQRSLFAPRAQQVLELAASHSPFLSQPAALAELLEGCCRA
jgi:pimeloyl-ACP methyl ester carboxylesterase